MQMQTPKLIQKVAQAVAARPWAYAYVLVGAVALCYYTALGFGYWTASISVARLAGQRGALEATLARPAPPDAVAAQQGSLAVAVSSFTYANLDQVLAQVMLATVDAGVSLVSLEAGDPTPLTEGAAIYQTLPLSITIQGNADQIEALVGDLHQRLPVTAVGSLRINGLESAPVAQLQYVVYLSPTPVPAKKGPVSAATTATKQ